jgi:hypothetical protein
VQRIALTRNKYSRFLGPDKGKVLRFRNLGQGEGEKGITENRTIKINDGLKIILI